jgi:hypothetical protein
MEKKTNDSKSTYLGLLVLVLVPIVACKLVHPAIRCIAWIATVSIVFYCIYRDHKDTMRSLNKENK